MDQSVQYRMFFLFNTNCYCGLSTIRCFIASNPQFSFSIPLQSWIECTFSIQSSHGILAQKPQITHLALQIQFCNQKRRLHRIYFARSDNNKLWQISVNPISLTPRHHQFILSILANYPRMIQHRSHLFSSSHLKYRVAVIRRDHLTHNVPKLSWDVEYNARSQQISVKP